MKGFRHAVWADPVTSKANAILHIASHSAMVTTHRERGPKRGARKENERTCAGERLGGGGGKGLVHT